MKVFNKRKRLGSSYLTQVALDGTRNYPKRYSIKRLLGISHWVLQSEELQTLALRKQFFSSAAFTQLDYRYYQALYGSSSQTSVVQVTAKVEVEKSTGEKHPLLGGRGKAPSQTKAAKTESYRIALATTHQERSSSHQMEPSKEVVQDAKAPNITFASVDTPLGGEKVFQNASKVALKKALSIGEEPRAIKRYDSLGSEQTPAKRSGHLDIKADSVSTMTRFLEERTLSNSSSDRNQDSGGSSEKARGLPHQIKPQMVSIDVPKQPGVPQLAAISSKAKVDAEENEPSKTGAESFIAQLTKQLESENFPEKQTSIKLNKARGVSHPVSWREVASPYPIADRRVFPKLNRQSKASEENREEGVPATVATRTRKYELKRRQKTAASGHHLRRSTRGDNNRKQSRPQAPGFFERVGLGQLQLRMYR